MFAAFMGDATAAGWVCHPESCGHDLVLRAGPTLDLDVWRGVERGDTVAVEGKLHPTLHLLAQALPPWSRFYHPTERTRAADWYAVLVPRCENDFRELAAAVGVLVFRWGPERGELWRRTDWPDDCRVPGLHPLELPPPVAMEAGRPAPRAVTRWKVGAVRLCLLALERGDREVTTTDFLASQVRPRSFVERQWIEPVRREGRVHVYRLCDRPDRPDLAYPELVTAIREADAAAAPVQGSLLGSVRP